MVECQIREDKDGNQTYFRDGIELSKGIALTTDWINERQSKLEEVCEFFSAYPDVFIDLITPADSAFNLFFYQRIFLRAAMRFRYNYWVAPRAASKTFLCILAMFLKCMFFPGTKTFICAPKVAQSAKIAKEKIEEILTLFPLLRKELVGDDYNSGGDYIKMTFRNGSVFDVVAALDSQRGGRRNGGLIDEVRDHDADDLNEIVLPLMNVNRRNKAGIINPNEPHQFQFYMTSAGTKNTFAYQKLIEVMENEIITPKSAFVWGCDYRVPMFHNLLDKNYLKEIKLSTTYKDESFAREYLGRWTGGGKDAWFDYDKMEKYRSIINPEKTRKVGDRDDIFYLISVDVGRLNCQTVACVFKCFKRQTEFVSNLVNIYVFGKTEEEKPFPIQALEIKRLIYKYEPLEVVIDANGLGIGLLEFMVMDTYDNQNGETYPPYCTSNLDSHSTKLYPNATPLIFGLKSNAALQSKIDSNCYSRVFSGKVRFLVKEQDIKSRLLGTKVGQKMKPEERAARILPHELTTRLHEEMSNLRLKSTGTEIKLEQINTHMLKDKFSSFEYGLWRIKELEEEYYQKVRRAISRNRTLVFFD